MTLIVALALADLAVLFVHSYFLPEEPQTLMKKPKRIIRYKRENPSINVDFIHKVNIFHEGKIPPSLNEKTSLENPLSEESQASNLPFKLLGTIENFDPKKSMASIYDTTKNETQSYMPEDVIDDKARVVKVERRKVTFLNLINKRLEHIEIPLEETLSFNPKLPEKLLLEKKKPSLNGISETGENKYSLPRSTINKHLQSLPDILQQARVEPRMGEKGQVQGFTFTWIQKDSLFESIGFQKGDTLISVNGEEFQNATEAEEAFRRFRTESQFSVVVEDQDGKRKTLSYDISEDASIE